MSIAIIGAGLAGLSAARALADAGCPVQLFDKSRGSGGRLSSRQSEAGSLDLGAQYFTARAPRFAAEVRRWQAAGWIAAWQPRLFQADAHGLTESPDAQQRWIGTPRMSALTRALLGELPVRFGCRISQLQRDPHGWFLLDTDSHRHGPFQHVLVAVPAAQAAALLDASPALAAAAAGVVMEPTWAVALSFAQALDSEVEACFVRHGPLSWLTRQRSRPGRAANPDTWLLHASSAWSAAHLQCEPREVSMQLLGSFAELIDCPLPAPSLTLAHRWLYARPAKPRQWGALADPALGLYACGDWCLSGRIEGAWLSGQAAAQKILEAR